MTKLLSLTLTIILLSGCAASGPKYKDQAESNQAPDASRLVFLRTGGDGQYSGRAATIKVDGTSAGGCEYKGFKAITVAPGSHTLTVDMWDAPGTCNLSVDTAAGAEYYFEIKPRSGNFVAGMLGGAIGMAIESSGKSCGGAFSIEALEKAAAVPKLAELRLSN